MGSNVYQPRPRNLPSGSFFLCGPQEIVTARMLTGIVVCVFENAHAAVACYFAEGQPVATLLARLCATIRRKFAGKAPLAKIVGGSGSASEGFARWQEEALSAIRREINACDVSIVAEDVSLETGRLVFFYAETGRLRLSRIELDQAVPPKRDRAPTNTPVKSSHAVPLKVFIVDDSLTMRNLLEHVLAAEPGLRVVGMAASAAEAERTLAILKPDVMTLDLNMPGLDGASFLEKLLRKTFIPTVIISSVNPENGPQALRALEVGAVDYIQKPSLTEMKEMAPLICETVLAAARSRRQNTGVERHGRVRPRDGQLKHHRPGGAMLPIVAIGASTGGTQALRAFLGGLPGEIPPVVVVQHIPPVFSKAFAEDLNSFCPFEVKEAEHGDLCLPGRVLIAPGARQMAIEPAPGGGYQVRLSDDPPVNRHRPSVDYLFDSVAKHVGKNAVGFILTGMGDDGAKGLLKMREAGASTVAQDEESCVVFGMPKEAIALGAADCVCPLEDMPEKFLQLVRSRRQKKTG